MSKYFLIYLLIMNLAGAAIAMLDKQKAKRGRWRIPEKTLFLLCALGGSFGMYTAMRLCRHKTLHKRFMLGIPLIFVLQVAAALLLLYHYKFL